MNVNTEVPQQTFPFVLSLLLQLPDAEFTRSISLNGPLTVLIGPNGSGKTHLLRAISQSAHAVANGKKVRFISAGRIGMMEQYRAIHNSSHSIPPYDDARLGKWHERGARHRFETLEGDYQTIAARPDIQLKVRERLKKLFQRDIMINWENSQLKVQFVREGSSPYSAAREASGLLHLAGLLAAIYDDEIGVLLLDEPEVSLHPQLQAFLLREIASVAGIPGERNKKIVVISTHSTEFLRIDSVDDLPNLVFTKDLMDPPVQIDPNAGELKNRKISELVSRMGQEHKLAFFARSPLLVEGPSDVIICAGLASKLDIQIEAGGSQILPVIGKGQFPAVVKLMRLMGKTPMVLADADAFTDSNDLANTFLSDPKANAAAVAYSHPSAMKMFSSAINDFTKLVDDKWSDIQPLACLTYYWKNQSADDGARKTEESKTKRRAAFSALFSSDESLLTVDWLAMRKRLSVVLDVLEIAGCHILRKGTVESYFQFAGTDHSESKPSVATEEAITFKTRTREEVEIQFDDILRCLRAAASSERISEADVIKETVLGIAAPALAKIRDGSPPDADLNAFAKSMGFSAAELFNLSIQDGKLIIELKSVILDIDCFPIEIDPSKDVVSVISDYINHAKRGK